MLKTTRFFCLFTAVFVLCCAIAPQSTAKDNAWHKIAFDKTHVVSIVSDPARPATLYAATFDGLMRSRDSGATWERLGEKLPVDMPPGAMAVNPHNSKEIYVGYDGGGLFKSQDEGATWQAVNNGLPNIYVRCIAISPRDPNLVYAGIQGGVAISTNGGKFWHMSSGLKHAVNVNTLLIDPKDPQYLYAGTGGAGVFKSGNGGVSWRDMNEGLSSLSILGLYIDAENPEILLAGAYHPASPTDLYVGKANGGVFRSLDAGRTWQETGLLNLTAFAFASVPNRPQAVYAAAWGGVYRSLDRGESWIDINTGLDNAFVHEIFVMPESPPVILAGTTFGLISYTDLTLEPLLRQQGKSSSILRYALGAAGIAALLLAILARRRAGNKKQADKKPAW